MKVLSTLLRMRARRPLSLRPRLCAGLLGLSLLAACGAGAGGGGHDTTPTPAQTALGTATNSLVGQGLAPGVVAVEVSLDQVSVGVQGVARVGGAALREADLMPLGSNTKPFTATLAALLVQNEKLRWDAKLLDVLPELRQAARAEYADVTLRDLLAHRAGIYPGLSKETIAAIPPLAGDVRSQRVRFAAWALAQPRTSGYGYSNGGYVVAAAMLERAAGAPYESLLQDRVLQPLGMSGAFGSPGSGGPLEPEGHLRSADGKTWVAREGNSPEAYFPPFAYPAGALKASGPGVARFLQMHLRALSGRNGELITPASAAILHSFDADGNGGLGWVAGRQGGVDFSWHYGSDQESYDALFFVSKQTGRAAAILKNSYDADSLGKMIAAAFPLIQ